MIRTIAVALVLSLTGFIGGGTLSRVAHAQSFTPYHPAQGTAIDQCSTTFPTPAPANPAQGNPYYIYNCGQVQSIYPGGGFCPNGACTDPYQDPAGEGIHWTGTAGSYAHFLCAVPSIVTGTEYATYSSSELDVLTGANSSTVQIFEQCTVQTPDRPGANLIAYFYPYNSCYNESDYGNQYQGSFGDNFYVTENATGAVTLHCNFSETLP